MTRPAELSPLGAVFVELLPMHLRPHVTGESELILRVPPVSMDVGELLVHDDHDELTVSVGNIHHCHFEVYCESGTAEERREAAQSAVDWIENIIADRVRFRNEFRDGRLVMGSSWMPEKGEVGPVLDSTDEYREYTWSGLQLHERCV